MEVHHSLGTFDALEAGSSSRAGAFDATGDLVEPGMVADTVACRYVESPTAWQSTLSIDAAEGTEVGGHI